MLNKLRSKQGFTLIELLIVVAIIGILAAIAIPQFSAYQKRGYASSTRSDVRNVHTAIKSAFADDAKAVKVSDLKTNAVTTSTSSIDTGTDVVGPKAYGNANISNGVTINVTDGPDALTGTTAAYFITGKHAKLGTNSYILTGDGSVTDTLSTGW